MAKVGAVILLCIVIVVVCVLLLIGINSAVDELQRNHPDKNPFGISRNCPGYSEHNDLQFAAIQNL